MSGKILIRFDPGLCAEGLMCNNFQFKAPSQDHVCEQRRGEGRPAHWLKEPVAEALSKALFECKCRGYLQRDLPRIYTDPDLSHWQAGWKQWKLKKVGNFSSNNIKGGHFFSFLIPTVLVSVTFWKWVASTCCNQSVCVCVWREVSNEYLRRLGMRSSVKRGVSWVWFITLRYHRCLRDTQSLLTSSLPPLQTGAWSLLSACWPIDQSARTLLRVLHVGSRLGLREHSEIGEIASAGCHATRCSVTRCRVLDAGFHLMLMLIIHLEGDNAIS